MVYTQKLLKAVGQRSLYQVELLRPKYHLDRDGFPQLPFLRNAYIYGMESTLNVKGYYAPRGRELIHHYLEISHSALEKWLFSNENINAPQAALILALSDSYREDWPELEHPALLVPKLRFGASLMSRPLPKGEQSVADQLFGYTLAFVNFLDARHRGASLTWKSGDNDLDDYVREIEELIT